MAGDSRADMDHIMSGRSSELISRLPETFQVTWQNEISVTGFVENEEQLANLMDVFQRISMTTFVYW